MDFELPEELRLLRQNLRRYVDTEMIPTERLSCIDQELVPEYAEKFEKGAKELGLWMMDIPEEFGG